MWDYLSTQYADLRLPIALFGAFLVSLVATPLVRELAKRNSLLDQPNHRSSHTVPVPRLGGVAIVGATVFGTVVLVRDATWEVSAILIAAAVMALAGFYDDLRSITAIQKYGPQLVAAIVAAWAVHPDFHVDLPFLELHIGGWQSVMLSAFWITAFINAFNFMDGVDGIAGGVGLVTALGLTVLTTGHAAFLLLPVAAALTGFLAWNVSPASIFMGDGGSQFVGFILAVGALYWPSFDVNLLVLLIAFAPFLFDTGFTLVWRIWNRLNVFQAHRSHLYQRLAAVGFGHREVANVYIGATALSVLSASGYFLAGATGQVLLLILLVLIAFAFVTFLTREEKRRTAGRANQVPRDKGLSPGSFPFNESHRREAKS